MLATDTSDEVSRRYAAAIHSFASSLLELTDKSIPIDLRQEVITRILVCHFTESAYMLLVDPLTACNPKNPSTLLPTIRTLVVNLKALCEEEKRDYADLASSLFVLLSKTRPGEDFTALLPKRFPYREKGLHSNEDT